MATKTDKKKGKEGFGMLLASLREILQHAAKENKGKVGTRKALQDRLQKTFPHANLFTIYSYISRAKVGRIPGCHTLTEKDYILYTGKIVPAARTLRKKGK